MNHCTDTKLVPALLALAVLLSGCGLYAPQPVVLPSGAAQEPDQPVTGGVLLDAPAWKAAETATATLPPTATKTSLPTAQPSLTATLTPVPTETPMPLALDPGCLLGTWEAANLTQAVGESLAVSGGSLVLDGVEGHAVYRFLPEGIMEIQYQGLSTFFSGMLDGRAVQVVQTLDGSGFAAYSADPVSGEILLSRFGGEGINSSLAINGQTLAEGSLPVWQAFAAGPAEADAPPLPDEVKVSRTAATCQGDLLTLQAIDPAPGPVVQLQRAP